MKITKLFVAALAGLAMVSCSSDDEMTNQMPKNTALSVKVSSIMNGGTRALGPAAAPGADGKVFVDGVATLTVNYTLDNTTDKEIVAKLTFKDGKCTAIDCQNADNVTADQDKKTVNVWNVGKVNSVKVTINNGVKTIADGTSIENYVSIPAKEIPAYAEEINPTLGKNQGAFNNQHGNASAVPDYKNYYLYEVTLTPENKEFARIELSGIYHKNGQNSKFQTLKLQDVCLDNTIDAKGSSTLNNINFGVAAIDWGFYHDKFTPAADFLATNSTSTLPAQAEGVNQSFGYNFWAGQMPTIRLHFVDAKEKEGEAAVMPNQWAFVKEYKNAATNATMTAADFKAGVIYRIVKAELADENILPTPDNDTENAIVVTVEPAYWTVTDINAVWAEK